MSHREFVNPAGLSRPTGYTHVVTARGQKLIYVAGQVAFNAEGQLVGWGDLQAQTRQVFQNLQVALASAGASFDDVVKITVYVVNYKPEDRQVLAEVRSQFVSKEHPPASTLIGVQALAQDGLLVEIEAVAVLD